MVYHNIPQTNYGTKFDITQLPDEFSVKCSDNDTFHIVYGWEDISFWMSLCGRTMRKDVYDEVVPNNWFCRSCLKSLEGKMEGYMYDKKNDEYYDPTEKK